VGDHLLTQLLIEVAMIRQAFGLTESEIRRLSRRDYRTRLQAAEKLMQAQRGG
jgi:hypothetical protein